MYKFAVLPYVNTIPLVHFIPQLCPDVKLIYHTPRNTISELINGNVDAAIIPVVDYFNTPGLEMVKGLGICADGNVESVLLQCRIQLKDVRSIKLDQASKASNLLSKVLVKNHFHIDHVVSFDEDIENADAEVMIGDRALRAEPAFESHDLAGKWQVMTGLPFVFAVWAYRTGHPDNMRLTQILHTAKQAGCNAIGILSKIYTLKLGISEQQCYHYLTDCIYYDIGPTEQAGMQLFRQLSMDLTSDYKRHIKTINIQNLKDTMNVKAQRQFA